MRHPSRRSPRRLIRKARRAEAALDVPPHDLADPTPLPDETGPERTCIVTREKRSKDGLIRFVVSPDRQVVPDIRAKLPGRGAWVLADAATVAMAVKRKAFSRAF